MHHTGSMVLWVIYNNRYAVGSRYTDADILLVRHQGIDTVEHLRAHLVGEAEEGLADLRNARAMHLMGHHEAILVNLQILAQSLAVLRDVGRIVATIKIDIKRAIVALAIAAMTGGAEGGHALSDVIEGQLGLKRPLPHTQSLPGPRDPLSPRRRYRRPPRPRPRRPVPRRSGSCPCRDARGCPRQ